MTTLTFPLSRIEGHARVVMEEEGGNLLSAQFQAVELRGFRNFVVGTPAEQRSEEPPSELPSPNTVSYAVFCLKTKKNTKQ